MAEYIEETRSGVQQDRAILENAESETDLTKGNAIADGIL